MGRTAGHGQPSGPPCPGQPVGAGGNRRIGQTDGGLTVYVYRYKGDNTFHMGVMAQEVEAVQPEAVVERPDGLKAVRYDLIGA
ncbi:tail fiber domain-containing protein [Leisingera sp. F5]|uniref:tail fiber domain-containing protein n=1 Tax=Leisingera sp. F5 TaxID=1813816 RepID=UPI000B129E94|nr:tail fiber domain-containing protein [Leisingera sp. F5]